MPLLLSDLETKLRTDLHDTDATQYRWQQPDLDRAIDRAVDKYSFVSPQLLASAIPTAPQARTYPMPAAASGNAWWIESVEYPSANFPNRYVAFRHDPPGPAIATPSLPLLGVGGSGATLPAGTYYVRYTWLTGSGETLAGAEASQAVSLGQSLTVTIPAFPLGGVTAANIYVATSSGNETKQGQVAASGSFVINTPLVVGAAMPVANTTGQPTFTMLIRGSRLPVDQTGVITIIAAYKHQVDNTVVTVPERHIDVILLGAYAYCCYSWGTPMADNFLFGDGEIRDRLDDTKVPAMWLKQGDEANTRFKARLEEIKRQRDAGAAAVANWGDIPSRWDRL